MSGTETVKQCSDSRLCSLVQDKEPVSTHFQEITYKYFCHKDNQYYYRCDSCKPTMFLNMG